MAELTSFQDGRWADEAQSLLNGFDRAAAAALLEQARSKARAAHGCEISYSPKVFIPLTRLCRDVCHYCTFVEVPKPGRRAYLTPDEIRAIAAAGIAAGCSEALFTLGEMPEVRYAAARDELATLGYATTNAYCAAMAAMVLRDFGLIPHINAGVMSSDEIVAFRKVSGSQGLMLETVSARLLERGQVHFGSPGKAPAARLATIEAAGAMSVPFTTGILIGIGETRVERVASLLAIRDSHVRHGHIQEVIVQNFLPKPGTKAAGREPVDLDDLLWTTAVARIVLPPDINLQVPPNLSFAQFGRLLDSGINDWGGISVVTPDHVNPEAAWPSVERLQAATAAAGLDLVARLPVYPAWLVDSERWIDATVLPAVKRASDADGWARDDSWMPGGLTPPPPARPAPPTPAPSRDGFAVDRILARAAAGERIDAADVTKLLRAREGAMSDVLAAADAMRRLLVGDTVTYVVNRNINYTNICSYRCGFCAFSKGRMHDHLRGRPYDLSLDEIGRRVEEAWSRGATEVCMQGGIHPRYTGETYLELLRTVKNAQPAIHVHAFSPLEIAHGAATLGMSEGDFLRRLRDTGLSSLPGTAAEILTDRVRERICPDKLDTAGWLRVVASAHAAGLPTTATIMFGHLETLEDVAAHLIAIRDLQAETGGFTEFVPLPFVSAEAPIALRGETRRGPTFREVLLVHAVARLTFGSLIPNIQASWVKLGREGTRRMLDAGVNDLGGTLMNESISRAAGAAHGEELPPADMEPIAREAGRPARQRTTLYGIPDPRHSARSFVAATLAPIVLTPPPRPSHRIKENG